jgi:hypothetical protein
LHSSYLNKSSISGAFINPYIHATEVKIQTLLAGNISMNEHFAAQSEILRKKAKELVKASEALNEVIKDCSKTKSVPWKTVIKLIEVYHMTEKLEKT